MGEKAVTKKNKVCTSCAQELGFFCQPRKCNKCNNLVCHKCVHRFSYLPKLLQWDKEDQYVCKSCWPDVKASLQKKALSSPQLKLCVDSELKLGSAQLGDKDNQNKDNKQPEKVDPLQSQFSEGRLKKCKCPFCKKKLSPLFGAVLCAQCKKPACWRSCCVGSFLVPEIDPVSPVTVCASCAPTISQKIEKPSQRIFEPQLQLSASVEPSSIDPKKLCALCNHPFSFLRRPHSCNTCDKVVCSLCSRKDSFLLFNNVRKCCDCLQKLKLLLPKLQRRDLYKCSKCDSKMKWINFEYLSDLASASSEKEVLIRLDMIETALCILDKKEKKL